MKTNPTQLEGLVVVEPRVFADPRGYFFESWNAARYKQLGVVCSFVQDNISVSSKGVLRGLHFQEPQSQDKLVQVLQGAVFDVVVDVRLGSPTFGKWFGIELSEANHIQLFIPVGFAHGFVTLADNTIFSYKCSAMYSPASELGIAWNDPELGIQWPIQAPELSSKDRGYPRLAELSRERLPKFRSAV